MNEYIEALLGLVLRLFGVTDGEEKKAFTDAVFSNLREDRERYICLETGEVRRSFVTPPEGRIGKLVLLAEHIRETREDDTWRKDYRQLYLMVTEKRARLVEMAYYRTVYDGMDPHFSFHDCVPADIFKLPGKLWLLPPKGIQHFIRPVENASLPMALRALDKLYGEGAAACMIPARAEQSLIALRHTDYEEYRMESGEVLEGALVTLGYTPYDFQEKSETEAMSVLRHFCLLETRDEVYYVIKTERETAHYRIVESKEDPGEMETEYENSQRVTEYRFASLDDISEDMRPGNPGN